MGAVPTDLLIAAEAHIDDVVREFTLIKSDQAATGVLLPDSGHEQAIAACDRVIDAMGDMSAGTRGGHRLTASAGVAPFAGNADRTLREAELALLAAKAHGRARVKNARCA